MPPGTDGKCLNVCQETIKVDVVFNRYLLILEELYDMIIKVLSCTLKREHLIIGGIAELKETRN